MFFQDNEEIIDFFEKKHAQLNANFLSWDDKWLLYDDAIKFLSFLLIYLFGITTKEIRWQ